MRRGLENQLAEGQTETARRVPTCRAAETTGTASEDPAAETIGTVSEGSAADAAERLVAAHYGDVLAYCRRHAPSRDEAEDLVQETFLRYVRSGSYVEEGKPLAYLITIARNLCIDAARRKRVETLPLDVDVADPAPASDPASATEGAALSEFVQALEPDLRDVVELRYDQDLSVGEVAAVLGVSRFAVNRRLKRAFSELRRGLAAGGCGNQRSNERMGG